MVSTSRADTIRAIFAAYLSNNRNLVEDALSDDFRFTSPYDDSIDRQTYFKRCWKSSDWIEGQWLVPGFTSYTIHSVPAASRIWRIARSPTGGRPTITPSVAARFAPALTRAHDFVIFHRARQANCELRRA